MQQALREMRRCVECLERCWHWNWQGTELDGWPMVPVEHLCHNKYRRIRLGTHFPDDEITGMKLEAVEGQSEAVNKLETAA